MIYTFGAMVALGAVIGFGFRLRVLLVFVGLVFLASIAVSLAFSNGVLGTLATIALAEAALQGGYFAGLVGRVAYRAGSRKLSFPSSDRRRTDWRSLHH